MVMTEILRRIERLERAAEPEAERFRFVIAEGYPMNGQAPHGSDDPDVLRFTFEIDRPFLDGEGSSWG
jgi:hypothetical protein